MMQHLDGELIRLAQRPVESAPSGLLAWEVDPLDDANEYAARLRSIVAGAIATAAATNFDVEKIDASLLPQWFVALTDGHEHPLIPEASRRGHEHYYSSSDESQWSTQEWLFCFDPESRPWSWWDVTSHQEKMTLWIDSKGEPVVACEELRWAVFAAGARSVTNLRVLNSEEWIKQPSIGI